MFHTGSASFIAALIVAFTILGSVLEGIRAIVLFGPLLFPVGVHEVYYAMVIILAMGIGAALRGRLLCGLGQWPPRSGRGR